jgi:hypothetical protein
MQDNYNYLLIEYINIKERIFMTDILDFLDNMEPPVDFTDMPAFQRDALMVVVPELEKRGYQVSSEVRFQCECCAGVRVSHPDKTKFNKTYVLCVAGPKPGIDREDTNYLICIDEPSAPVGS